MLSKCGLASAIIVLSCTVFVSMSFAERECERETRKHCSRFSQTRDVDEFRFDRRLRYKPNLILDRSGYSRSDAEVIDWGDRSATVRWSVGRFSCLRYTIEYCD